MSESGAEPVPGIEPHRNSRAAAIQSTIERLLAENPGKLRHLWARFAVLDRTLRTLARGRLLQIFQSMGVFRTGNEVWEEDALKLRLGIAANRDRLFRALLSLFVRSGVLKRESGRFQTSALIDSPHLKAAQCALAALRDRLLQRLPDALPQVLLLERCMDQYPALLQGRVGTFSVLFPHGSMDLVQNFHSGNVISDYLNHFLGELVAACSPGAAAQRQKSFQTLRVIEIGAGTGGSSQAVLARLAEVGEAVIYFYTDISPTFLRHGEDRFVARAPFACFRRLDIEKSPADQGFEPGTFDLAFATNVAHATRSLVRTLSHIRSLLNPEGILILNESTRALDLLTLTFGLTSGWWIPEDPEYRIEDCPLSRCRQWREVLVRSSFQPLKIIGIGREQEDTFYQSLIVARTNDAA
jgi:SAM-dependent methyltransferase